jgi:pantothenate kinase
MADAADRFLTIGRERWAALRAATPLDLTDADLDELRGINDRLDLDEVTEIYLPLSRLLSLHVVATRDLRTVADTFLGYLPAAVPYIIGVAGSVAVGKSTTARILQALLGRWPVHPRVELVTTDGFLYPNAVLAERGLAARKGFPESYDVRRLVSVLTALKAGEAEVRVPTYSHVRWTVISSWFAGPTWSSSRASTSSRSGRAPGPSCPTSSTSPSMWTPPRRTSRHGSSSGSACCGARCSPTRPRSSTPMPA